MGNPLFPRWSNTVARASAFVAAALPAVALGGLWILNRSPWITGQGITVEQPVQFDHRHHVRDEGIDCRYCHTSVETGPSAGMPSTQVCMSCHEQIWNKSEYLAPLRKAYFANQPLQWNRVHKLPDYVYFNHSAHVNRGVGCFSCHGRVDEMAAVAQAQPLTMGWCLSCHKNPEPNLRPKQFITSMTWTPEQSLDKAPAKEGEHGAAHAQGESPALVQGADLGKAPHAKFGYSEGILGGTGPQLVTAADATELGKKLSAEYHVHSRVSCSTCHR